jgi:hypothetical protein
MAEKAINNITIQNIKKYENLLKLYDRAEVINEISS